MKSPSFSEESCLGKSFSLSRGEQPCHFSPVQDIFHNYKEELSHNSSTQLQLIPSPLLAFAAGPCSTFPKGDEWRRGHLPAAMFPTLAAPAMCQEPGQMGSASPSGGVPRRAPHGWGEGIQLS